MPNLTSLGDAGIVNTLQVGKLIPLTSNPVITIQTPVNFSDGTNVLDIIDTDVKTLGSFSLYSGTDLSNIYSNINRYRIKLTANNFVIYDVVNGIERMSIDAITGIITFNPPLSAPSGSLIINNADAYVGTLFPLFSQTSVSGTITQIDTISLMTFNPVTDTLNLYNLKALYILDGANNTGSANQVLSTTGSSLAWTTLPTIGNGTLTIANGTHILGSGSFTANQSGSTSITISTDATNLNTASTIVARDATGNFVCNVMTGTSTKVDLNNVLASNLYYNVALGSTIGGSPYGSKTINIGDNTLTFNPVTGILGCVTIQASLNALFLTGMYSGMYNFLYL